MRNAMALSWVILLSITTFTFGADEPEYKEIKGHEGPTRIGLFTPDGKTIVTASGWPAGDATVRVFDVATQKERFKLLGHKKNIDSMAISPDGKFVCSGGGSEEGMVRVWDVATGKQTAVFEGHGKGQNVSCVLVSPDGKLVASGGSSKLFFLWDPTTGKKIRQLEGHTDLVRCLAFTTDGKTLCSGSWDGTVKVWDVATGKEKLSFKPKTKWVTGLAMLPDGKQLLVACDNFSRWDITTGEELKKYPFAGNCVAVTADGKKMISGFFHGKVTLAEVETGKKLAVFQAHIGHIHGLCFTNDGKYFSTAGGGGYENNKEVKGEDFMVRIWKVEE